MGVDAVRDAVTVVLVLCGLAFFTAGTVGLLRFPDLRSRLHALTKADNVGLGFVVLGLLAQVSSVGSALKLLLVWALALAAGATAGPLLARAADPAADPAADLSPDHPTDPRGRRDG